MNNPAQWIKSKDRSVTRAELLVILGAAASIAWSLYFAKTIVSMPYQIGYREGAPQVLTQMLLNGENFSTFENQPLGYNAYGIGYQAAVLPFAYFFGNTLHVHRWVTFIFVLLSTLTGYWIVRQRKQSFPLAFTCSAFIMIAFIGWGGIGAAPTSMGVFLFLAAAFIPRHRSFDATGMVLSLILALAALHTKAYFVLSFGIAASYIFLFLSKKRGAIYLLVFAALFAGSLIGMQRIFPLYIVNVIFGNAANTVRSFERLFTQLVWLAVYFLPLLIITISAIWRASRGNESAARSEKIKFDILTPSKPLLQTPFDYYSYVFLACFLAFVLILGSHIGNYLAYAYELVVPTFLFWFFVRFGQKKALTGFTAAAIIFNLFSWQYITLTPGMLEQRKSVEWQKAFSYLKPSMKVLNSPAVASRLVELGIQPVDSGQTDVYYLMKPYPNHPLIGPSYEEYYRDGLEYTESINRAIKAREYDLIITTKDVDVFYDLDLIAANYVMIDQLILHMQQTEQKWVVQIWEPLP
jgi:hypothetical protein